MHVPSFQAGPRARALTRMARTPRSRPRSCWLHAPVPDSEGPSALGHALLLHTAPCHGQRAPKHHHHRARPGACKPHGPSSLGICGLASTATSRCRHVRPGARSTGGHGSDQGENAYHGKPLADSGTSPTREPLPTSYRRYPDGTSPAQVGRVYPKPPRCSPSGDANGFRLP